MPVRVQGVSVSEGSAKRTVLILHPGALGDVLLAIPAIRALREKFSRHAIVLIASIAVSRLLVECGLIDNGVPLEGQASLGLFSDTSSLPKELQSWLKRCDLVVAWTEDTDGILAAQCRKWGVVRVHIQSPSSPSLRVRHQCDRFLETLGETAQGISSEQSIRLPSHLVERAKGYLDALEVSHDRPFALVHPGSGSVHKCLEARRMASLIERLQQEGMCPLVLEGPADRDAVNKVRCFLEKPPLVLKDLDLSLVAGILAWATFYVGHDSGVTHLAALLGVRTIAIFGPTDHQRWGPYGRHVSIVRGMPCGCKSWETVKSCAEKPCLHVPVDQVWEAARRILCRRPNNANPHNSTETALSPTTT